MLESARVVLWLSCGKLTIGDASSNSAELLSMAVLMLNG